MKLRPVTILCADPATHPPEKILNMTRADHKIEDIEMYTQGAMVWRDSRAFFVPFSNILHIEFIRVDE